jgi:2-oxoglutarate dehydrogenase E2 component (dihydrolipoamide succinyltransferase)
VKRDEPIFEISTDKVDAEIPRRRRHPPRSSVTEGQTVAGWALVAAHRDRQGARRFGALRHAGPAAGAAPRPGRAAHPTRGRGARRGRAARANGNGFEERSPHQELAAGAQDRRRARRRDLRAAGLGDRRARDEARPRAFIESGAPQPRGALAERPGARRRAPAAPSTRRAARAVGGGPSLGDLHAPSVESLPGDVVEPMSRIRSSPAST